MSQSRSRRRADERVGPYRLAQPLGRGGMAEVWTARDSRLAAAPLVVVKRILLHFAEEPEFVAMLRSEARVMAQLDHPNIVRLVDHGDDGALPYLVLELVEGLELARVMGKLRGLGPMPVGLAAFVARELARALDYLHRLGLVHRDVSPSNVMLGFDGGVKLLDFGIAKALAAASDDVKTRTGVLKGKLGYLSPEQVDGEAVDARSDQFSLGIVLHELCTGARLFVGDTAPLLLLQVRAAKVSAPSLLNPAVPPALDRVCLRALARSREERFADCGELAAALDAVVAELRFGAAELRELVAMIDLEPTVSRSQLPTPTPTAKAARRRPRRTWLLLVVAALVVAAGLAWWWLRTPPPPEPAPPNPPAELPPPPTVPPPPPQRVAPPTPATPPPPTSPATAPTTPAAATAPAKPAEKTGDKRPRPARVNKPSAAPPSEVVDPWNP